MLFNHSNNDKQYRTDGPTKQEFLILTRDQWFQPFQTSILALEDSRKIGKKESIFHKHLHCAFNVAGNRKNIFQTWLINIVTL